jgi:hypothetical protein
MRAARSCLAAYPAGTSDPTDPAWYFEHTAPANRSCLGAAANLAATPTWEHADRFNPTSSRTAVSNTVRVGLDAHLTKPSSADPTRLRRTPEAY